MQGLIFIGISLRSARTHLHWDFNHSLRLKLVLCRCLYINSVQELKTDGTFYSMPQFLSHTEAVANGGGLVMMKDKVSIVIHPIGSNKFGHSFVCCLK